MKKLFFCAAALLAAISFAACSDNDEPNLPITSESIVGTWQAIHEKGYCIYDDGEESGKETWSDDYPDEDGYYWTLTFDKNGTCVKTEYDSGKSYSVHYTYSISGNMLTLNYSGEDEAEEYEIKKLTESQLVLFEKGVDANYSWENTTTYKRIK